MKSQSREEGIRGRAPAGILQFLTQARRISLAPSQRLPSVRSAVIPALHSHLQTFFPKLGMFQVQEQDNQLRREVPCPPHPSKSISFCPVFAQNKGRRLAIRLVSIVFHNISASFFALWFVSTSKRFVWVLILSFPGPFLRMKTPAVRGSAGASFCLNLWFSSAGFYATIPFP